MKKVYWILIALQAFIFTSCEKESISPKPPDPPPETRTKINLRFDALGTLSQKRSGAAIATAGNKIFFAGGGDESITYSTVDIYDIVTHTWSTAQLSEARSGIVAVTVGNKVLFAGGAKHFDYDAGWKNFSKRMDIYNLATNTWSATEMPVAFEAVYEKSGAVVNDKAFFVYEDKLYIYNVTANAWSYKLLSRSRHKYVIASAGTKVLVAGGGSRERSKDVDIYDALTNTQTIDKLIEERELIRAVTVDNKVMFAGGIWNGAYSSRVDIYDNATQKWSFHTLSMQTVVTGAVSAGQRAIFFNLDKKNADVYDASNGTWYIADLPFYFTEYAYFINAGGTVYAVDQGEVWQLKW